MKRVYTLLTASLLMLSSCNSWLDVSPSNEIDDDDLFASGSGYRTALNGVYKELSNQNLYGQELTWGLAEVLAQNYDRSQLGSSSEKYYNAARYLYDNQSVEPVIQSIWTQAFFAIANCNALLEKVETAESCLFAGGEYEHDMIWGEALALRALTHFDILRLFAPAPDADDGKAYIPYVDTFPSTVNGYLSVTDVLGRIEQDLIAAREKLARVDLEQGLYLLKTEHRFEGGFSSEGVLNNDQFYTLRGFRMNYTAATALLARVYSYAGRAREAAEMAAEVIDFLDDAGNKVFTFTDKDTFDVNPKMFHDLVFALSNSHLVDYFKEWTGATAGAMLCMDYDTYEEILAEDRADRRWSDAGGLWEINLGDYYAMSRKFMDETTYSAMSRRIIPMIRLSEMYYIRAEYLAQTSPEEAAAQVDVVSTARGCTPRTFAGLSADDFQEVLLLDAQKEFFGEGQLYFLYKKLGIKPHSSANFVFPLPDNEQIH